MNEATGSNLDTYPEPVDEMRTLFERSTRKLAEVRKAEILALLKSKLFFRMSDVTACFPDVPRRTLEKDLEWLMKDRLLRE